MPKHCVVSCQTCSFKPKRLLGGGGDKYVCAKSLLLLSCMLIFRSSDSALKFCPYCPLIFFLHLPCIISTVSDFSLSV